MPINKSWSLGVLPQAFKLDPKIMLPKPGKSNYNTVRSYRPITLESVIGKIMERVINKRLVWKLVSRGGSCEDTICLQKTEVLCTNSFEDV